MALSEEVIARRFRAVDQTSESIQTTSMWILHHRDSASQFVNCWIEVFKTASDTLQIALFYVANDVCQKAKKKDDSHVLLQAFAPQWVNAISYSRSSEIVQKAVTRILDIFDERQIYSKSQLADMRAAQNDSSELDDSTLLDFDIGYLIRDVEGYHKGNLVMERARELLSRSDFNFKDKIKSRMKDRRDGEKFMAEIEQSYTKLTDFFEALAKHRKRGQHLLGEIERAKRCFTLQLRDVTVVEDAYQKFGCGIDEVRAEVEEMLKAGVYPGASPPRDAPSPTANDDPFREGVETAFRQMRRAQSGGTHSLPLPKVLTEEETTVASNFLQTDQLFKGSVQMLKIIEGIRGNEASRTASAVVCDPRLAFHSSSTVPLTEVGPVVTATTSSLSLLQPQSSASGKVVTCTSVPSVQLQVSHIPSQQLPGSSSVSAVASVQSTRNPPPNGTFPAWTVGPSPTFSAAPSSVAVFRSVASTAALSGTTNSLQTPVVSSQLQDNLTGSKTTTVSVFGDQSLPSNADSQSELSLQSARILPPPPPDMHLPIETPLSSNFISAAIPSYAKVPTTSTSSPSAVSFLPGSFTIPPPVLLTIPSQTPINISRSGVMDYPSVGTFYPNTSCSSSASPIASRSYTVPEPSNSSSIVTTALMTADLKKHSANGSSSNSSVDSGRASGESRHESKKCATIYDDISKTSLDRHPFGGFRSSGNVDRRIMRDSCSRNRDRERSGSSRGSQYDNGGRRYSSDSRNRVPRYRDYDDNRCTRRYEPPRNDFIHNRR